MQHKILDAISIDTVIFGFTGGRLEVLLVRHARGRSRGIWSLPGGWIYEDEDMDAAAYRLLEDLTGVSDLYLEQLKAFGTVDRFPDYRVITIAYFALVRLEKYRLKKSDELLELAWYPLQEVPSLTYDHDHILDQAVQRLKLKIKTQPIGFNLLPEKFTLHDLQKLYETILGISLDKPNFRRKMKKMNVLQPCDELQTGVNHRAARLYSFDEKNYNKLLEEGFSFYI